MHRIRLMLIAAVLGAAALVVPAAYGEHCPHSPAVGEGYSFGPVNAADIAEPPQRRPTEGWRLIPDSYVVASPAAGEDHGFDWTAAGIGAALGTGVVLILVGFGTLAVRARRPGGRLSSA